MSRKNKDDEPAKVPERERYEVTDAEINEDVPETLPEVPEPPPSIDEINAEAAKAGVFVPDTRTIAEQIAGSGPAGEASEASVAEYAEAAEAATEATAEAATKSVELAEEDAAAKKEAADAPEQCD